MVRKLAVRGNGAIFAQRTTRRSIELSINLKRIHALSHEIEVQLRVLVMQLGLLLLELLMLLREYAPFVVFAITVV